MKTNFVYLLKSNYTDTFLNSKIVYINNELINLVLFIIFLVLSLYYTNTHVHIHVVFKAATVM